VVIASLSSNIYFINKYSDSRSDLRSCVETQQANGKKVAFIKLFIEKILKAQKELDMGTVIELENAAKATGDKEIVAQWQKFLAVKTIGGAQQEIQDLLEQVINKIRTD
jgi:hypothetical protein